MVMFSIAFTGLRQSLAHWITQFDLSANNTRGPSDVYCVCPDGSCHCSNNYFWKVNRSMIGWMVYVKGEPAMWSGDLSHLKKCVAALTIRTQCDIEIKPLTAGDV